MIVGINYPPILKKITIQLKCFTFKFCTCIGTPKIMPEFQTPAMQE
jgi:hypothetical protein